MQPVEGLIAMKSLYFVGNALEALRTFPGEARRDAGYELNRVQHCLDPGDWRPMNVVGAGVREIRIRDLSGIFRVFYVANVGNAVYVLHAFNKKTHRTAQIDIDLGRKRFKEIK
jgi:phage-related protein